MISVSDSALDQLKGLLTEQTAAQPVGMRVYIQSGGCSGFSYGMGLDENPPKEDDQVVDVKGLRVYVDSYTINNPNAVKTCGCGHSFQTADSAGEAKACSH
jgi:iron-sulfur cluster assembly protein